MRELPQDTLTVKELQQILKIGTNSAYTLIHSNAFPVIKSGRATGFLRLLSMPGWGIPALRTIRPNLQ